MSKDFRVATSFFTHKKTVRLIRKLGLEGPWYLLKLWAWAREHCPDGDLEDMTGQDIEEVIGWNGEVGAFIRETTDKNTLYLLCIDEKYVLYNWDIHNSWASKSAERSEIARKNVNKRWEKEKEKQGSLYQSDTNSTKGVDTPSPSPSPLPKKENIYTIFDFWNKQGIIKHRSLTKKFESCINARLNDGYKEYELLEAICNFAFIIEDSEFYWTHKWAIDDFFIPQNLDRFLTENNPFVAFRQKKAETSAEPKYTPRKKS